MLVLKFRRIGGTGSSSSYLNLQLPSRLGLITRLGEVEFDKRSESYIKPDLLASARDYTSSGHTHHEIGGGGYSYNHKSPTRQLQLLHCDVDI